MDASIKSNLKIKAHHLKPIILLGNKGLTDAVLNETNNALVAHELIKIKLPGLERAVRQSTILQLCQKLNAQCIQSIGHIAVIYRKKKN